MVMKRAHEGILKSQNPMFMKWLNEIKQETKGILAYNVGKAIMSLQKCPNKLKTAKDCLNLKFFGNKICQLLEKKAKEYKNTDNQDSSADNDDFDDEDENVGGKRAKNDSMTSNETYVPVKVDFNAYIILSIMYKHKQESTYRGHISKKTIVSEAKKFIDYQMNDDADEDFSFKSAMSSLIAENCVIQKSPNLFCITNSGANIIASSLVFENPPNPLFVKWLTQMEEEARERKSKKQVTLKKLLNIFRKCPIRLKSAKDYMDFDSIFNHDDAMNLEWTKEIFNELDRKLEQYEKENNQHLHSDGEESDTDGEKSDTDGKESDTDGMELDTYDEKSDTDGEKSDTDGKELDTDGEDIEEELAKKTEKVFIQTGRKTKAEGVKK